MEASIRRACGGGQPLDYNLSTRLSSVLDGDLSGIRVHTDREADELNRRLGAEAFTVGEDIFFSQGAYGPDSWAGAGWSPWR